MVDTFFGLLHELVITTMKITHYAYNSFVIIKKAHALSLENMCNIIRYACMLYIIIMSRVDDISDLFIVILICIFSSMQ